MTYFCFWETHGKYHDATWNNINHITSFLNIYSFAQRSHRLIHSPLSCSFLFSKFIISSFISLNIQGRTFPQNNLHILTDTIDQPSNVTQRGGTWFRFNRLNQEVWQCLGLQLSTIFGPKNRFFSTMSDNKILFLDLDIWFFGSNTYNIPWFYAWFWPVLAKMLQNQRLDIQILEVFHQKKPCA